MDQEPLSALLDGELDELATVRLLRVLDEHPELLERWEEFGLIGDALREHDGVATAGCAGALRAIEAIRAEPAPARTARAWMRGLPPHSIPWAIAASAALVAFTLAGGPSAPVPPGAIAGAGNDAGRIRTVAHEVLARAGIGEPDAEPSDLGEMDRYIDFHREVDMPGFQRTALEGGTMAGGGRGQ